MITTILLTLAINPIFGYCILRALGVDVYKHIFSGNYNERVSTPWLLVILYLICSIWWLALLSIAYKSKKQV